MTFFYPYTAFTIVHIVDVLVFSNSTDQHFMDVHILTCTVEKSCLAIFGNKMVLKIRFLGHGIYQSSIKPIMRSLEFAEKFRYIIKD